MEQFVGMEKEMGQLPLIRLDWHITWIFLWNRKKKKKIVNNFLGKMDDNWRRGIGCSVVTIFSLGPVVGVRISRHQPGITLDDQNLKSGSTSIAQANFARRDLLNICEVNIIRNEPQLNNEASQQTIIANTVYLLNWNFMSLAPCNCNPRVKVIEIGRAHVWTPVT